jgi:hypothetical protein
VLPLGPPEPVVVVLRVVEVAGGPPGTGETVVLLDVPADGTVTVVDELTGGAAGSIVVVMPPGGVLVVVVVVDC